jgi:ATP-binding cassette, subfamily B, bacterial
MKIFLRITALFWKQRRKALLTYFLLFAGAALSIYIPNLTGQAIDLALGSGKTGLLVLTAVGIAGAGILRGIINYGQTYLAEALSQHVSFDLRNALYNHLQKLSYAFHDKSQTGQLMSRATSDVEGVRMFVGFALLRGVYFIVLGVAIIVLLLVINWKLAIISIITIPFISYRTLAIRNQFRGLYTKIQQGLGVMGTYIQESIVGAKVVRAFAREKYETDKFMRQAKENYNWDIKISRLWAINSQLMSLALYLAMAGILWYGGRLVIEGTMTTGTMTEFLLYVVMLSMPVRTLGWLAQLYSRALSSGQRVFEVLDAETDVKEKPGAAEFVNCKGDIKFENVSFSYGAEQEVLRDITFEAKPGQVIALVGASGSGKSTVANLIPRFYDVTQGRITIEGHDLRDLTLESLRRNVGIVHQDTFIFSATIRENISYGKPGATQEEITKAARAARLHDFIMGLPEGYETWVGERGITLSGGQKQRLAIARTLLLDPCIIIMDDATSSVDMETEGEIRQALNSLLKGRTTFIIAQRLRSVQMAGLILVLEDGKVVERGSHAELIAQNGYYAKLYNLQFQYQEGWQPDKEEAPFVAAEEIPAEETVISVLADAAKETPILPHTPKTKTKSSLSDSDDIVFGKPYDSHVVGRMAKYFGEHKGAVVLTIITTLLYNGSLVASPYLVGLAINDYISKGDISGLNFAIILFLGNSMLNFVSCWAQIRVEMTIGIKILLRLRREAFTQLQRLSISFFDHNEAGRIMSRAQDDVGELGDFFDSGVFWVVGEVVSLVAIVVIMLVMDWKMALLGLAVVPFLLWFIVVWQKKARHDFMQTRQTHAAVNGALQENITGIRLIQSLSREKINSEAFEKVNRENLNANIRAAKSSAVMMPVVEALVSAAVALVLIYGGIGVLGGTLLVGTLIAFNLYIQQFFEPIRALTMEYTQLQRAMASAARIFELTDMKQEITDKPDAVVLPRIKGSIVFEDVSFKYETGSEILHGVSFKIAPGETAALVGPTGAGKSTMMSLIARFYDVSGGRLLIDGHDIRDIEQISYRSQLGLVLQDPFLFSGTIADNIRYGNPQASDAEVISAAKTVGAHDFIIKMEKGYETPLQERGQNLSMGQRQLISFTRALLANPAILLLDEATANMDSYSERVLQEALKELLKGRTAVVIAHRLSTIKNADHIAVMENGRIVEEGRHESLLKQGGLYARLYEMTFRDRA